MQQSQGRIYREANEAYAAGPLSCMCPFQGSGGGELEISSHGHAFKKNCKSKTF